MKKRTSDDKWGLTALHKKMLEILMYINEFCKNNNIDYALAYGSTLGAVRHSGFIPWDDDADVYMTLDGYKRFKELFNISGDKEKFYLQEMDSVNGMITFAKLRMNGTTYIEPLFQNYDIHHGIYVDIFILFNAPRYSIQRRMMNLANQYLQLKDLSNRGYNENKNFALLLACLRLFPYNFGRKRALEYIYRISNMTESDEYYDTDLRKYSKSFYRKDIIFPSIKCEFEGIQLQIPNQPEKYLTLLYGDYKRIPSLDSIRHSQHAMKWSTTEDFHMLTLASSDYTDEHRF